MITIDDILSASQAVKTKIKDFYQLIMDEVEDDANLDEANSESKVAQFRLWLFIPAAVSAIVDSVWEDRQKQISDKVDSGIPGTDPWLYKEVFKFQYGDTLQWDANTGKYYYAVIDPTKQIVKRAAIVSSVGITRVKVATEDGSGNPIPFTAPQLAAFDNFITRQIQWSGASIDHPVSFNSDKLDAPMEVYYRGTRKLEDIKAIVQAAWNGYLAVLPFNAEYSVNKHGDFVEASDPDITEVNTGVVRARSDSGSFTNVIRVYNPVSGYLQRDPGISLDTMITYIPV